MKTLIMIIGALLIFGGSLYAALTWGLASQLMVGAGVLGASLVWLGANY